MSHEAETTARKKMAHVIAIGIEPTKGGDEKAEEPKGPDAGLVTAMEEFAAAIKAGDAEAMAEAFESAKSLC